MRNLQNLIVILLSIFNCYTVSGQTTLELTDEFRTIKSKQYNLKYAHVYLVDSNTTYFLNKIDSNSFILLRPNTFTNDVVEIQIETCKFSFYLEIESKYLENNDLKLYVYKTSNVNQATLSIVNLAVRLPLKVVKKRKKFKCKRWIKTF